MLNELKKPSATSAHRCPVLKTKPDTEDAYRKGSGRRRDRMAPQFRREAILKARALKKHCHVAVLALVGCYLLVPPAMAMDCEKDTLSDVSGSGAILEMLSGQIYKIDEVDQIEETNSLVLSNCTVDMSQELQKRGVSHYIYITPGLIPA